MKEKGTESPSAAVDTREPNDNGKELPTVTIREDRVITPGQSTFAGTSNSEYSVAIAPRMPSSSLPLVDIVPENLRKDIIKGKDINLVQLLIPARERGSFTGHREITIGDQTLSLKPLGDKRLSKALTISEFVKAFNMFKNIMCEVFPSRREELDRYVSILIDISAKYQGFAHYEYHIEFSARAAYFKEHRNILVDWGVLDDRLLTQIVAGRKANTCTLCGGYDHVTTFCNFANEGEKKEKIWEKKSLPCAYYNTTTGCNRHPCFYVHQCSFCKTPGHPEYKCSIKKSKNNNRQK